MAELGYEGVADYPKPVEQLSSRHFKAGVKRGREEGFWSSWWWGFAAGVPAGLALSAGLLKVV